MPRALFSRITELNFIFSIHTKTEMDCHKDKNYNKITNKVSKKVNKFSLKEKIFLFDEVDYIYGSAEMKSI